MSCLLGNFTQVTHQFEALRFAARERVQWLPKFQIAQTDIDEWFQAACDFRIFSEEGDGCFDVKIKYFGDRFPMTFYLEYFGFKALSVTALTGYKEIGDELHLNALITKS